MRNWLFILAAALACCGTGAPAAAQTAGKASSDCPNCPEMVPIPPGSFTMGTSLEEQARFGTPPETRGRSFPLRKVTFARGFAMAAYPVTVAQFRTFVEETGYQTSDSCYTQHEVERHFIYEKVRGYSWRSPGYAQNDKHPVVCVSWDDAMAYAEWLSKKTGRRYTLPNEAQYEYAARAGTTTAFFWGDERDARTCEYANEPDFEQGRALGNVPMGPEYRFQCSDGYAWTSPVGNYKPNPFGLYDMLGNIWEWAADCWNDNFKGAPTDGSTWTTGDCDARPARGGSFGNAPFASYVGTRAPRDADYVGHSWGFRVVRND